MRTLAKGKAGIIRRKKVGSWNKNEVGRKQKV
jgi:hypothetical protein